MKKIAKNFREKVNSFFRKHAEVVIMTGFFLIVAGALLFIIKNDYLNGLIVIIIGCAIATYGCQVLPNTSERGIEQ
jgi:hypothetical protein